MDVIKRVELSPVKVIPGFMTVWNEQTPDVDLVMDMHNLQFRDESIDEIFAFHVVEHLFDHEIPAVLKNWRKNLKQGGNLFIIANDFEYVARQVVGGDISIKDVNQKFSTPSQMSREYLVFLLEQAGFDANHQKLWFTDVPERCRKEENELIISAERHGK